MSMGLGLWKRASNEYNMKHIRCTGSLFHCLESRYHTDIWLETAG